MSQRKTTSQGGDKTDSEGEGEANDEDGNEDEETNAALDMDPDQFLDLVTSSQSFQIFMIGLHELAFPSLSSKLGHLLLTR